MLQAVFLTMLIRRSLVYTVLIFTYIVQLLAFILNETKIILIKVLSDLKLVQCVQGFGEYPNKLLASLKSLQKKSIWQNNNNSPLRCFSPASKRDKESGRARGKWEH